jgi:UDP-4-amino-4,6-dideoxy-N-acetyl-beta-L-altrosamine transaminase
VNKPSQFLSYGRQTIDQDDIDAVVDALKGDFLTTGPKIAEFEKAFCDVVGAKESVVVNNGTSALHLACMVSDLKEGDYAIVPSVTFLATANAVRYCGAEVIFCDVDPHTGLMTAEILEKTIEQNRDKNIKAVLPVHLAGACVDLPAIKDIADKFQLEIIADSCHALGSRLRNIKIGSCKYEDMATFSFHPVKNITMGEGGAIALNCPKKAEEMRRLRSHNMHHLPDQGPWFHEMRSLGNNYRATDIQCALGISQLKKLDAMIERRQVIATQYNAFFADFHSAIKPPEPQPNAYSALHLYALRIDFEALNMTRTDLMNALKEYQIGTQVHYIPVHTQPYYEERYGDCDLPGSAQYYKRTLSIPLFPMMTDDDITYVQEIFQKVIAS